MRQLTSHQVNPANEKLAIDVLDEPGSGGANHAYRISGFDASANPSLAVGGTPFGTLILFQNGPIGEFGVNGVTNEAILAVVEDRLAGFQAGPYACAENADALGFVRSAQQTLKNRTSRRTSEGVEGTHQPDAPIADRPPGELVERTLSKDRIVHIHGIPVYARANSTLATSAGNWRLVDEYEAHDAKRTGMGTAEAAAPPATPIRHPAVHAVLQFFAFAHLPPALQEVSRHFHEMAERIANGPNNAETTVALRKLLEAKDAAVRAMLFKA